MSSESLGIHGSYLCVRAAAADAYAVDARDRATFSHGFRRRHVSRRFADLASANHGDVARRRRGGRATRAAPRGSFQVNYSQTSPVVAERNKGRASGEYAGFILLKKLA
jgi:hypothetical protein